MQEESILLWMVLQLTLDWPWQHTYAWNKHLDRLILAIDSSNIQVTSTLFDKFFQGASITKALWNLLSGHWSIPK